MQTCGICGKIRPDSQDACDCMQAGASPPALLGSRTPALTAVSLVTTGLVEFIIVAAGSVPLSNAGFGALGIYCFGWGALFAGVVINIVLGYFVHKRRETWGGRIPAIGIGTWIATIVMVKLRNPDGIF